MRKSIARKPTRDSDLGDESASGIGGVARAEFVWRTARRSLEYGLAVACGWSRDCRHGVPANSKRLTTVAFNAASN